MVCSLANKSSSVPRIVFRTEYDFHASVQYVRAEHMYVVPGTSYAVQYGVLYGVWSTPYEVPRTGFRARCSKFGSGNADSPIEKAPAKCVIPHFLPIFLLALTLSGATGVFCKGSQQHNSFIGSFRSVHLPRPSLVGPCVF